MQRTSAAACALLSLFPAQDLAPSLGYANRLDVFGVRIEGTQEVDDDWLYLTALVFERMTRASEPYDLRARLSANGFRILLAGEDEPLGDLPEYADHDIPEDVGGLGGNPGEPTVAVRVGHPHTLIHELAHGIYHTVIQFAELDGSSDPEVVEAPPAAGSFTARLREAYDTALAAGTWAGVYLDAHADEYWAEGVALWFRCPERNFASELRAELLPGQSELLERDPRAFLVARDPALAALADEVFTAEDWWPATMGVHGRDRLEFPSQEEHGPGDGEERPPDRSPAGLSPPAPTSFDLAPLPSEGRLAAFAGRFARTIEVFGVTVVATADVGEGKVAHAARILAEWMDNDEDGVVDDPRVAARLIEGGAFLVMFASERDARRAMRGLERAAERAGLRIGQDLYGDETLPDGPPHRRGAGRFDATLEEVWHLVSNGWCAAYPGAFAYEPGSRLTDAMDVARGGRFRTIPRETPEGAWYHYDDETCGYECMAAEYFYWTLTSWLGGQDYPGRAEEIAGEWECPTPELLERRDAAVHRLLTDPAFALPRVLPDGVYRGMGAR
ncbi:MAG: hypothetical protein CMJ84_11510 [Planctomycetes bacterium]|nr:hypothetical protein [Planctomycetota bacterium]MDP6407823.1 hypothetical protein [Planctomycetota bacterium]